MNPLAFAKIYSAIMENNKSRTLFTFAVFLYIIHLINGVDREICYETTQYDLRCKCIKTAGHEHQ